jgi:Na+/H+ antiporter NhaC
MYSLFNLSGMLYALLSGLRTYNIKEYYAGVLFGQVTILIAAIIWLAAAVISGEFYMKHAGERKSWVMMAWIFGIEIFLILLNLLFGG